MLYAPFVVDWNSFWTAVGTFVGSAAGVAVLLGSARGIYGLLDQRGPRKRVEAIKAAQDALAALPAGAAAGYVALHRERELEALGRVLFRKRVRSAQWRRSLSFVDRAWVSKTVIVLAGLANVGVLFAPQGEAPFSFTPTGVVVVIVAFILNAVALPVLWIRQRHIDERSFYGFAAELRTVDSDQLPAALEALDKWVAIANPPDPLWVWMREQLRRRPADRDRTTD